MKNTTRWLLFVLSAILIILFSCFGTYSIMASKLTIEPDQFAGTYCINGDSINEKYVYVRLKANGDMVYGEYDSKGNIGNAGKCTGTDKNILTLYAKNGNYYGTIIYSYEKYCYIGGNSKAKYVKKISDSAILP